MYSSQYTVIIAEDEELLLTNLVSKINNLGTDFIVTGQSLIFVCPSWMGLR